MVIEPGLSNNSPLKNLDSNAAKEQSMLMPGDYAAATLQQAHAVNTIVRRAVSPYVFNKGGFEKRIRF